MALVRQVAVAQVEYHSYLAVQLVADALWALVNLLKKATIIPESVPQKEDNNLNPTGRVRMPMRAGKNMEHLAWQLQVSWPTVAENFFGNQYFWSAPPLFSGLGTFPRTYITVAPPPLPPPPPPA